MPPFSPTGLSLIDGHDCSNTADHALLLTGTTWSVWRDALLRTAGFPAAGLTLLSAPGCARVADEFLRSECCEAEFDAIFTEAVACNSADIRDLASDPLLREAIAWQSLSALTALDQIVSAGPAPHRTAKHRARERMILRYWQRYCGKAETVGFFGPVCWVTVDPAESGVLARPGTHLIRSRSVYFDYWPLAAIADQLAADPLLRAWLPPVLCPQLTLRDRHVLDPIRPPVRLTGAQAAVVSRCDGRKPGWQVAAEAIGDPATALRNTADVYYLLNQLVQQGIIHWDFNLPVSFDAERVLWERLGQIADDDVRDTALGTFAAVCAQRDRVIAQAGDPDGLVEALLGLQDVFTRLSGQAATRRNGAAYAGRTLCVEETTRDLDVTFGAGVIEAIASALAVPLAIADWVCCSLAEAYLRELERLYADLGPGDVLLGQLWFLAQEAFYGAAPRPADQVAADLGRRWASLFGLDRIQPADRRLEFSSELLAAPLAEFFPGGQTTWAAARIHSPDLQFCAPSAETFARDDFIAVLGEMHPAFPSASNSVCVARHPDPVRLRDALRRDMAGQSVYPLLPPDWPRHTARLAFALEHPHDVQLGFTAAAGADLRRLLPISSLVVRPSDSGLTALAADGRTWPLIEFFGRPLSEMAMEVFKSAVAGSHAPRITVDRLVVARESWSLAVGDCPVTMARGERDQYLALRRWKAALGLPEHVFVKLASEVKPMFVDMTSPGYAPMLAAALRAARKDQGDGASLQVTEMLPTPADVWVLDAAGRRYVSELRLHLRHERAAPAEQPPTSWKQAGR
ncbi:MAG: lantibiotic dehydratase [Streptosporangiaceae bacterium]